MQRRTLLRQIGTASTIVFGASTAAAASSSGPDGVAEAERLVRLNENGGPVVLDISDVEDPSELDDGPSTMDDCDTCAYECCSDCPDWCIDKCGGCLCGGDC